MILTVDIGNTETMLGAYRDLEPLRSWRISSNRARTGDELGFMIQGFLAPLAEDASLPVERAVIASVVPSLDWAWEEACRGLELPFRFLDGHARLPIRLDVEMPAEVGADRIANTLAAAELYGRDTLVVDLGTATTFDCISADGVFLGGVIAPGPRAGMEWLTDAAAQLSPVEIRPPERVIGRNTAECLDSGVFYSAVDAIDGIVQRILEEWQPDDPLVVATGGLAGLFVPHCETVQRVEPYLTLTGLAIADRYLSDAAA
jgi:type III pantothenate kinase